MKYYISYSESKTVEVIPSVDILEASKHRIVSEEEIQKNLIEFESKSFIPTFIFKNPIKDSLEIESNEEIKDKGHLITIYFTQETPGKITCGNWQLGGFFSTMRAARDQVEKLKEGISPDLKEVTIVIDTLFIEE